MSRAVGLADLTDLEGDVEALCARALAGPVAAVCVAPGAVASAAAALDGTPVRVGTVANFPAGLDDARATRAEVERAIAAGADEVDVVLPHLAWAARDRAAALAVVAASREAAADATLKVILEAGRLEGHVAAAATAALEAGADFVCTSTGKLRPGATPAVARPMLEAIRDHGRGGFKAAGGIRTAEDVAAYLALADEIVGAGWTAPETFRVAADAALVDALAADTAGRA